MAGIHGAIETAWDECRIRDCPEGAATGEGLNDVDPGTAADLGPT